MIHAPEKYITQARKFCNGEYDFNVGGQDWRAAFEYLVNYPQNLTFDKLKIHNLWTVNGGHLRRKVSDDNLILAVLTLALPRYEGNGLNLYRGECRFLYEGNQIGFCWTPDINVASQFASGLNAIESGGVLLMAYAPTSTILAEPNEHSVNQMREFEYICNPRLLENIEVLEHFERPSRN